MQIKHKNFAQPTLYEPGHLSLARIAINYVAYIKSKVSLSIPPTIIYKKQQYYAELKNAEMGEIKESDSKFRTY